MSKYYDQGVKACLSEDKEPKCPYSDETSPQEYKEWCDGFCHRIQDIKNNLQGDLAC